MVALGGSATSDGGAGLLRSLGWQLLDRRGDPVGPGNAGLGELAAIRPPAVDPLDGLSLVGLYDVTAPLLGPGGTIAVYGAQKGLGDAARAEAEARLGHWRALLASTLPERDVAALSERPGAGAAGGLGFALLVAGGQLRSGAAWFSDLLRLRDHIDRADLVVTGEGCLDDQTLHGKLPAAVASMAREAGVPVVCVSGDVRLTPEDVHRHFDAAWSLSAWDARAAQDVELSRRLLRRAGREIAAMRPGPRPTTVGGGPLRAD